MKNIVCSKFDDIIHLNKTKEKKRVRIGSKNPNILTTMLYEPISTDGKNILYNNNIYSARNFFIETHTTILNNLIVLTIKEREILLEILVDFNLDINILEVKYPIFNHIKYISNIHKNYEELTKLLNIISQLNIKGNSIAQYFSIEYLYKVERKLRYKNRLDYFFAFAYKGGYSEVFKLKEERTDRAVIAFDFNSMYVDSMMGEFMEPKSIKYENFKDKKVDIDNLKMGLYKVILKNPKDTFFKQFHPFKYVKVNKSYYFNLEEDQNIELLLFNNELVYYKQFFNNIEIIEGFCNEKTISHPLKEYARELYNERLKYKLEGNHLMNNFCKFKLITIHSSTNAKRLKTLYFETKNDIVEYLSLNYLINFPDYMSASQKISLIEDGKYFIFKKSGNGYKAKLINFDTHETVYSLSAHIVANARLKMIQTIEKFIQHHSVEICYTNIDSLHISILKSEVDAFLQKHNNMISDKLGDLKIEATSTRGYWFDVGRYWLFSKRNVDLFKNSLFNYTGERTQFIKNRKIKYIYNTPIYNYVKTTYLSVAKSFTYHKKIDKTNIDNYNFNRYNFTEINSLEVALESYSNEVLRSKKIKMKLFDKISTV